MYILKEIISNPVFTYISRYSSVRFSGGGTALQLLVYLLKNFAI